MSMFRATRVLCAVGAVAMFAAYADASLIEIEGQPQNSTENLGQFEGTISYVPDISATTLGVLTINLTNTTPASIGGFITGFVFNINSTDPNATASLVSATHPFEGVTDHMAPPFGHNFTAGAALGGNWSGGGNPNPGISVGNSGEFIFNVVASDAQSLTAASFISGMYDHNFVVRFRGMGDGSDKVPGGSVSQLPAPGALAMLAAAGLVTARRRQR